MTTLRRGDSGTEVRTLQRALNNASFNAGTVDGIFGSRTEEAVRAFQRANGLQVDGIVGPRTWAALTPYIEYEDEYLKRGDRGPYVEMLQLALTRAGFSVGTIDGIFGPRTESALRAFQRANNLQLDGIAGPRTLSALKPYLTGYVEYTVKRGDTLYSIARRYGIPLQTLLTANPRSNPDLIFVGETITVPLPFALIPTNISYTSELVDLLVEGLTKRYPLIKSSTIGRSTIGNPIHALSFGTGRRKAGYNAAHHANEWITTPVLLKFLEDYASAYASGTLIGGVSASRLYNGVTLYIVPMVNPDGVDLVSGALTSGNNYYDMARRLSNNYPNIPFPSGWKANIEGVDLNVNYPANWEDARRIKFAQGYTLPGPRDFVGTSALSALESKVMYDFTRAQDFDLTISYHSQGEVIYWQYRNYDVPNAYNIAREMSRASGYELAPSPQDSNAGYRDWFIVDFRRPGYTVEVGRGTNPLPLSQFNAIYRDNLPILTIGMDALI